MALAKRSAREEFDRNRILTAAARARATRRRRKAIELYRWVLAVEPRNADLHARLAPLLAETGQSYEAWVSYQTAARSSARQNHTERAIALYREATRSLPKEERSWQAIARLQLKAGREREALETLLEGSRQFHRRAVRSRAIHLLRLAREIDPCDFETVLELARLLASLDQGREAGLLLERLAARCGGAPLRRVRSAQFWLAPGLASGFRWLRAALRPAAPARRPRSAPALALVRPTQRPRRQIG